MPATVLGTDFVGLLVLLTSGTAPTSKESSLHDPAVRLLPTLFQVRSLTLLSSPFLH